MAGEEGFEPSQTESESVVLPLHNSPIKIFNSKDGLATEQTEFAARDRNGMDVPLCQRDK